MSSVNLDAREPSWECRERPRPSRPADPPICGREGGWCSGSAGRLSGGGGAGVGSRPASSSFSSWIRDVASVAAADDMAGGGGDGGAE